MPSQLNRRAALGLGATAAAGVVLRSTAVASAGGTEPGQAPPEPTPTTPEQARRRVSTVYRCETTRAGGSWNSLITVADPDGTPVPAVEDEADEQVEAYSVNKIAVATAVLDGVDRGLRRLDQRVDVTADIVATTGDGIFRLDQAYPSSVTLGHVMANLLSVSDDTAVRLCGLVCPAQEVNAVLVAKGFPATQVTPVSDPNRFFLGRTTPRETHDLLQALVRGTLLSATSTGFLLDILRSPVAFTDGIRRTMSSDERLRVATKAGWFSDGRNEAGIVFDATGRPILTYALFARGQADPDDFGATHPAVQARAVMGREFLDAVDRLDGVGALCPPVPTYRPVNGG
jgi:beta-lactamase class A